MVKLEEFITEIEAHGFGVEWGRLRCGKAGYHHQTRTIWMDHRLASRPTEAICTLAHEYAHATRGDDGPQPAWVEDWCDEYAARLLISPIEYAVAESIYGPYPAALAAELGVTRRLVEAYQRILEIAA